MRRYPDRGMHGRVVEALGVRIVGGEVAPQEILDTERLAEEYGVSRTVMREALRVLGGKGLIDARPRRGTFAQERSAWNLLDPDVLRWQFETVPDAGMFDRLHELRVIVEPAAAELAASRRTEEDLEALQIAVDGMAASEPAADEIANHDLDFHLGLIAATHNDLVEQLSTVIGIGLAGRDRHVHGNRISIERGLDHHRRVLDAVRNQDGHRARERMIELLTAAAQDAREASA
jgi:GntR family galactonate operon transcriptional repressor